MAETLAKLIKRGQLIIDKLQEIGDNAEYYISPQIQLLISTNRPKLLGHVDYEMYQNKKCARWNQIYVNIQSIHQREIGGKIKYSHKIF